MDDLLRVASVQAQAEATILNGGRELDFIAVAPIIAGGADGLMNRFSCLAFGKNSM